MPATSFALSNLARLGAELDDAVIATEARAIAEQLERGEINVLVVGQFKRGKSTVVNALLGEDLMPTGALPLTGVATVARYGEEPGIVVEFRDGTRRSASDDDLRTYVSERSNPKNALGVSHVEATRPAQMLRDVALFDTPGVGSIFKHNSAAARATLPRTDAAILVVGPDPPVGDEERAYAREVAQASVQLFVVFNKADIAGDALDELLAFTREALREIVGAVEIYPMSATAARAAQRLGRTDEHFERFASALRAFVDERATTALALSAGRRARALLERAETLVRIRRTALDLPDAERRERRAALEAALQALDDRVRFLELAVDDDVRRLRLRLEDTSDRRYDRERAAFVAGADEIAREPSSARRRDAIEVAVASQARAWRDDAVAQAEHALEEYAAKYSRLLSEIEHAVIQAGCDASRVDAHALATREIAFEPAKLTVAVSADPTTGLELLRDLAVDLLPRAARERALRARIARTLESELDAIRGKLRYGVAHDLEAWRRSMHETISSSLAATRSAVLAAFPKTSSSDDGTRATVHALERELAALQASPAGIAL